MIRQTLRCENCKRTFDIPKFYFEKHGLDAPPFERVAVCPHCRSDEFILFDTAVEKIEVAERLLMTIAAFNRYFDGLKKLFGATCENRDFDEGYAILTEFINEMFDFISVGTEREILKVQTKNDVERILHYLKG